MAVSQPLDAPKPKDRPDYRERIAYSYLCNPRVCGDHTLAHPHCYCGVALEAEAIRAWEALGRDWRKLVCFWCNAEAHGIDVNDLVAVRRWLARDLTAPGMSDPQMPGERGR